MTKKWYAVYTKYRWEKKVASLLTKKKIINYCPLNSVVRQWSDRKKIVMEPLFTSYVFVQIRDTEYVKVKETEGVINFVHWLGKPAVIKDVEIDIIQRFLSEHNNVQLEKTAINVNDIVRISSGPLMEYEGSVTCIMNSKVKVSLPSLGYMMIAEVHKTNVEIITPSPTIYHYAS